MEIILNLLTTQRQQWSHDLIMMVYSIITMMGHTHLLCPYILPELSEITISQFSRSHFNTYLMQGCIFLCVKVN